MGYSYEEALKQSIEYFKGDELAAEVYLGKYALKDPDITDEHNILEPSPKHMFKRLSKELARIEKKYPNPLTEKQIFNYLDGFKHIVLQGSPMAAIGNEKMLMSLSNCFVIDSPLDSYAGIFLSDQEEAQIMKHRGGVGFDISNLRPKDTSINNAAQHSTGIGPFMERFSNTCREVAQGGRRGALMITISVHHPEIETFINIKKDRKKVTGANVSIKLTDEFMKAVKENKEFELRFPVESTTPTITRKISAKKLWDTIIEAAWDSAEPGLLFWDTALRLTPAEAYKDRGFHHVSTNPCSELVLSPYDSCRLTLMNLFSYVKNPYTKSAKFDFEKFYNHTIDGQRLMDDIVDLELEHINKILNKIKADPEPEHIKQTEQNLWEKIKENCINGRRTGLGITAMGDTIAACGLKYGSKQSIELTEKIYKTLCLGSYRSSVTMAKERGSFPVYDYSLEKNHPFLKQIWAEDKKLLKDYKKYGRRNIANLTTAPAGSVSILTQTTSGIEPAFLLSYKRRKKINPNDKNARVDFVDHLGDKWQEYKVYHHGFNQWMETNKKTEEDVEQSPYFKATSNEIDWEASVELQAVAQKWVDHAISKTCNLPKETTQELVSNVYMKAWEAGCKGFTIYRDGSRTGVLINEETEKKNKKKEADGVKSDINFVEHHAPKRPKELICDINQMTVGGEKWTLFVGMFNDKPYEIMGGLSKYVNIPKRVKTGKIIKNNGTNKAATYDVVYDFEKGPDEETVIKDITSAFENSLYAAFTRTISLALRHGTPVQYIVEQLVKGSEKEDDLFSFSRAVSRVLKSYIKDGTKVSGGSNKCPSCSGELRYTEGCVSCSSCGFSKCT